MSQNYGFDVVEYLIQFSDLITHFDKAFDVERLDSIIQNAKAVFIHDSFPPNDFKERVCYLTKEIGVPLIIFTGGEAATIWDKENANIISKMKKDRFYHYLIPLLNRHRDNPEEPINIRNFVFGKNYEIERSLIIQDRLGLFLRERYENFHYESDFIGDTPQFKDLYELFYLLYGETSEEEFAKFDDKHLERRRAVNEFFLEIKLLVSQIISKYEE